jgi:hypothetical protein
MRGLLAISSAVIGAYEAEDRCGQGEPRQRRNGGQAAPNRAL